MIEAVVELLEVKRQVFAELDRLAPAHAILATNSSYLGNSRLADATARPDKVVNMHFFYPPLVMQLVEVVRGAATSEETVEATVELARRLGKTPVRVNQGAAGFPGQPHFAGDLPPRPIFCSTRAWPPSTDIDLACELGLNHPMGPFRLGDFSGLDIGYNARIERFRETGDEAYRPSPELEKGCSAATSAAKPAAASTITRRSHPNRSKTEDPKDPQEIRHGAGKRRRPGLPEALRAWVKPPSAACTPRAPK